VDWLVERLVSGQLSNWEDTNEWLRTIQNAPGQSSYLRVVLAFFPPACLAALNDDQQSQIAEKLLQAEIDDQENAVNYWNELGYRLKNHTERYEEAEQAYRKAIEIDPKFAFPWNGLGNLLQDHTERYEEAEQAYRKAIEIDPKFAYPWNGLGNLLQRHIERYEEAEQAYRKAIELDPKGAYPWYGLGNLLRYHTERYEEAEQAYRKAIEIDPKYAQPWNGLGNLLKNHTERYEEAEQAYRKAIELDPKSAYPWNGLGNLLCDFLGRYDEAELALRRSLELDPKEISPQINLVFLLRDFRRQPSEAKEIFDQISRSASDFQDVFLLHDALFAAYERDWQTTADRLGAALDSTPNGFPPTTIDDWIRASAVLINLGDGESLVELLVARGDHKRLRPWFEAIQAILAGQRKLLLNVAPEVRLTAECFFDQIQWRLNQLRSLALDPKNA
jgi:tetratricopeptide (TPR) repeat protein